MFAGSSSRQYGDSAREATIYNLAIAAAAVNSF
jgi:hypothetical protein